MFAPNKKLGQNFLKDKRKIKDMVNALDAHEGDVIVEVGGGLGALTTQIVETYGTKDIQIKTLEIDPRYAAKLKTMFPHQDNLEVIEANVLEWLPKFDSGRRNVRLIGSLPYYITTPILQEVIRMSVKPKVCVLLIQKEVVEKISQIPPDSVPISVLVQTFFEVEDLGIVNKSEFVPVPQVDGGIVKLEKRKEVEDLDIRKYEGFLRKAFANPRKMLNKTFYADELNRSGLDGGMRAQNYGWKDWLRAFKILV